MYRCPSKLTNLYLKLNQLAYSIVAFPIGTVLSIGPLLLTEDKIISLQSVGWFMAGGKVLGIFAMKMAEMSPHGFIFARPHDLHFINAAISISLIMSNQKS